MTMPEAPSPSCRTWRNPGTIHSPLTSVTPSSTADRPAGRCTADRLRTLEPQQCLRCGNVGIPGKNGHTWTAGKLTRGLGSEFLDDEPVELPRAARLRGPIRRQRPGQTLLD